MSDDNPDKKDMTRIEDLSEFLHNDDPEVDRLLSDSDDASFGEEDTEVSEMNAFPYSSSDEESEELPPAPSAELDDLDDLPDLPGASTDEFAEAETEDEDEDNPFGTDSEDAFSGEDNPFESSEFSSGEDDAFATSEDSFFSEDASEEADEENEAGDFSFDTDEDSSFESFEESAPEPEPGSYEVDEEEDEDEDDEEDAEAEFTAAPADEEDAKEQESDNEFIETLAVEENEVEPPPRPTPAHYPVRENFEDLKKFANSLSYGDVSSPGNPPFSLVIKDIKYKEDAEDILRILREHSLVTDDNEKDFSVGLEQGAVLIGQLSEYSAIYLAHRLRRFDLDISIGLSDEIHPAKSYEREGRGLTTKDQLYQNKKLAQNMDHTPVHPNDIIVATTPTLSGYQIERYIDVITEHVIISDEELRQASGHQEIPSSVGEEVNSQEELGRDYHIGLSQIYYALMQELKPRAHKLGGNAVLGINFSLVSLAGSETYKITCAGNVAWVNNE